MKRLLIYIVFFYGLTFTSSIAKQNIDSLSGVLQNAEADTNRVTILNQLATEFININPDSALTYNDQAFILAETLGNDMLLAECYYVIGNILRAKYNYVQAAEMHLEALAIYEELGAATGWNLIEIGNDYYWMNEYETAKRYFKSAHNEFDSTNNVLGTAVSLNNIGMVYAFQGNYLEAVRYCYKALEIYEGLGNKAGIAWSYELIAEVHIEQNNYDKALDYLFKMKKIYGKLRDTRGLIVSYLMIGQIYNIQGDYPQAFDYYSLSLKFSEESGDKIKIGVSYNRLGELYAAKKEYVKALEYQTKALHLQEEIKDRREMSATLSNMGGIYLEMANFSKAIEHLKKSIKVADEIGYKSALKNSYEKIAQAYSQRGNFKNAYKYHQLYSAMKDELFDEKKSNSIRELQAKYENEEKEKEIILLNKEKRIRDLVMRRDTIVQYSMFAGLLMLALLGFVIHNRYRIKQKANEELKKLNENMEDIVERRTSEVVKQRDEIEKTYTNTKLLSSIGKTITSSLSVEKIIETAYESVNILMDASAFCIGVYNKEKNCIEFPGVIEKGKPLPFFTVTLDKEDQMPVVCFKKKQEILINDMATEARAFIGVDPDKIALKGEVVSALIYLPLYIKKEVIGVISVQSFKKDVYTPYNVDMLRNLAVYVGIALENARGYEIVEEKVRLRTAEVVQQKQRIEKAYQDVELLSGIGKDITSLLTVEEIIEKVYKNVNTLMDASAFAIGIYKEDEKELYFPGVIEKGKKLPDVSISLDDISRPAVVCFKNNKVLFINNEEDYGKYISDRSTPVAGDDPISIIYLPLISKDKSIGVITAQSFEKNAYTDYHLKILQNIAVYTAIALENAHLYENMEATVAERTEELLKQKKQVEVSYDNIKILSEIGRQLTSTLNIENIFNKLHKNVSQLMSADCFGIRIYHPEKNIVEYKFEIEKGERDKATDISMDDDDNYTVWCIKNKKEIFINDNQKEYKKYTKKIVVPRGEMPDSLLFHPMIFGKKVLGVITVQSFEKNAYTKYHADILKTLASYTAIALENAGIYEQLEEKIRERNGM